MRTKSLLWTLIVVMILVALRGSMIAAASVQEGAPSPHAEASPTNQIADNKVLIWRQLSPADSPQARRFTAMAYDSARGQVVLFGGETTLYNYLNDTWEWDGTNWVQVFPAVAPSARAGYDLVYDSAAGQVVLYGGFDGIWPTDTWEWDGSNWTQHVISPNPLGRTSHAMAYDIARDRTVLFGGFSNQHLNDLWEWDGSGWAEIVPADAPVERDYHAMAYDDARGLVVLFGGDDGAVFLDDTWVWDGVDWLEQSPPVSPPARVRHSMVYDSAREVVVLFGGDGLNDTWEWDGITWRERCPLVSPPARSGYGLAYDSVHEQVVLFGGLGATGILSDTWVLDVLQLEASNDSPTALGNPTTLTATLSGADTVTFTWDFGDGTTDSGSVVTHTYSAPGTYTAMVTVSLDTCMEAVATTTVVVPDVPIDGLQAYNDSPTYAESPTAFTATVDAGTNVTFTWDFGDGTSGVGELVTHTYSTPMTYTAIVTASNSVSTLVATTTVVITEAPVADLQLSHSSHATRGNPTVFTATVAAGSNVTFNWTFGDGTFGIGAVVTHTYTIAMTYTVVVTASNSVSMVTATMDIFIAEPVYNAYLPLIYRGPGERMMFLYLDQPDGAVSTDDYRLDRGRSR